VKLAWGTLDRYILREVTVAWVAVTGILLLILVGNQLAQVLGQAASGRLPRDVVFALIALTSVQNLTVLIPVGLLLGIVMALGRMYHESEMAAVRAGGIGPGRLYVPIFMLGIAVTAANSWFALEAAPRAFAKAQSIRFEALREAEIGELEPGRFQSFAGGSAVFYAESADADGTLHRVFVQRRVDGRVELAVAARARHEIYENGRLHVIVLYDGERYEGIPGKPEFRRIVFAEHGIPIRLPDPKSKAGRVEARSTPDLWRSPGRAEQAELQWRLSLPVMALLLTLLAVPLSELHPRQGRYARLGLAILLYFLYSNLISAARTMVEKGTLPAFPGVWTVHLVLLVGTLVLLYRRAPPGGPRPARISA
jgi:lipopolysaccharide export system permease protein